MKKSRDANKRLKLFRNAEKMSQAELAEFLSKVLKSNIEQSNISAVESGLRSVPDEWVKALHFHKQLNYEWFYAGTGIRKLSELKEKSLVLNTAELNTTIELLQVKIKSLERTIDKLWDKAYPDEK